MQYSADLSSWQSNTSEKQLNGAKLRHCQIPATARRRRMMEIMIGLLMVSVASFFVYCIFRANRYL
jgi:hypothetical protein